MLTEYLHDTLDAYKAKSEVQKLTFYPIMFQAARVILISGILKETYSHRKNGISPNEIAKKLNIPIYGVKTLLEVGLSIGLVFLKGSDEYAITKMGHFLLNDRAALVNLNFTHDVCYKAIYHLEESIKTEKPLGLKEIGLEEFSTIYPGLSSLEEPIKTSWFDFDHYYSDNAFPAALEIVFLNPPSHIIDIGGNTGKWSVACCNHNSNVKMTILDLASQINVAINEIEKNNLQHRISTKVGNVLETKVELPKDVDIVWMSQFLDCFSEDQIVNILINLCKSMDENTTIFILELFWDRQKDFAAAYALHATSLYFSAVANGNSKMYSSEDFYKLISRAGLVVTSDSNLVGNFHTLLKCRKMEHKD